MTISNMTGPAATALMARIEAYLKHMHVATAEQIGADLGIHKHDIGRVLKSMRQEELVMVDPKPKCKREAKQWMLGVDPSVRASAVELASKRPVLSACPKDFPAQWELVTALFGQARAT